MRMEKDIVPYRTAELPEGPWLVFAPHADDETLGMGGSILRARQAGIPVSVVIVTDGGQGGDADDLVQVRRQEAKAACARLGVEDVRFLGVPDRHLICRDEIVEKCSQAVASIEPRAVFFTSSQDLHPDHRGLAAVLWAVRQRFLERNIDYYAYEVGIQGNCNTLIDISETIDGKLQATREYESQLAQNDYTGHMLAMNKARTYTLPRGVAYAEAFYRYQHGSGGLLTWQQQHDASQTHGLLPVPRPLLSLIVPVGQPAEGLDMLLDSLARQRWSNLEIVLLGAKALPELEPLVSDYALCLPGLMVRPFADAGGGALLRQLKGEWLGVLSADMVLHDDALIALLSFANEHALDAVGSRLAWQWVAADGDVIMPLGGPLQKTVEGEAAAADHGGWFIRRESVLGLDLRCEPRGVVHLQSRQPSRQALLTRPVLQKNVVSLDAWLEATGERLQSGTDEPGTRLLREAAWLGEEYSRRYGHAPQVQEIARRLAEERDVLEAFARRQHVDNQRIWQALQAQKVALQQVRGEIRDALTSRQGILDSMTEGRFWDRSQQLAPPLDPAGREASFQSPRQHLRRQLLKRLFGVGLFRKLFSRDSG